MSKTKEENRECPLCMEPFEMDDVNFFPCTCGYQICRFCWHRIRTNENSLCPACRKQYSEDPANFKPLTAEELQKIKDEKKLKDIQRKQRISEKRKHLGNLRVVQKNLVFVVGLPMRLSEVEELKKPTYFGKFGKINKVIINQNTSYAGSQGPSVSAYITYHKSDDALRAIQAVNNTKVDGRTLKASLGTTKYCSNFLRKLRCPKLDCMYLHEVGEEAGSFTKEEMQIGKHQEYEQRLHETMLANLNTQNRKAPSPIDNTEVVFLQKEEWSSPAATKVCPQSNLSDSPNSESTESTLNSAACEEESARSESPYVNNEECPQMKLPAPLVETNVTAVREPSENKRKVETSNCDIAVNSSTALPSSWQPSIAPDMPNPSLSSPRQQWHENHIPNQSKRLYADRSVGTEQQDPQERSLPNGTLNDMSNQRPPVIQPVGNVNCISPSKKVASSPVEWAESRDYVMQLQAFHTLPPAPPATNNFVSNLSQVNPVSSAQRNSNVTSRYRGAFSMTDVPNLYSGVSSPNQSTVNSQSHNGLTNYSTNKMNTFNQNSLNSHNQLGFTSHSQISPMGNLCQNGVGGCLQNGLTNHSQMESSSFSQNSLLPNSYPRFNDVEIAVDDDDDLGFDPFQESSKGLADLMQKEADEKVKLETMIQARNTAATKNPVYNEETAFHNHSLENSHYTLQRQMVPPPGFSINNYGAFSTPRPILGDAFPKKTLPVMNTYNQSASALTSTQCQPEVHPQMAATTFNNTSSRMREKSLRPQMSDWQNSLSNLTAHRQMDSSLSSASNRMPLYMGRENSSPVWNASADAASPWISQEQCLNQNLTESASTLKLEKMIQQMKLNEQTVRLPNQMRFNTFSTYRGGST